MKTDALHLKCPPAAQLIVGGGLIWAAERLVPYGRFAFDGQTVSAWVIIAAGLVIVLSAARTFRKAETTLTPLAPDETSALVVSGPFRWSRNPIYLGFVMILIGLALHLGSLPGLLVPVLFVVSITRFQIIPEERALAEKFGEEFHSYKKRVRRWL